jgi:two-component system, OmpR family, alkaline phosphatase synthesis response regulator PhoP
MNPTDTSKTILIADDDADIAYIVKFILEREGYRVLHIPDGTVTERLTLCKPDLIIMDWNLGGVNGGNLCKQIKQNENTAHIQIILFSACEDLKYKATACKADDYLSKPFDLTSLVGKVGHLLASQSVAC